MTTSRGPARRLLAAGGCLLLLALAACGGGSGGNSGGGSSPGSTATGTAVRGGVYRTAVTSFGLTNNMDPVGETQIGFACALYDARSLGDWPRSGTKAGTTSTQIVPDLATSVPTPTDNGLTYTFHLKPGIKFAPPVNREITSQDIAVRLPADQRCEARRPVRLLLRRGHQGADRRAKPRTTTSPGSRRRIRRRSSSTSPHRSVTSCSASRPRPLRRCRPRWPSASTQAGTYGRDVVASGPYMFQGSGAVDIKSCSTIKPMSGFDPDEEHHAGAQPELRPGHGRHPASYLNGVQISVDPNVADIFDRIRRASSTGP